MPDHAGPEVGPPLAVDHEHHLLNQGAADVIGRRVVGKAHDHPVHKRLLGPQYAPEAVARHGAAVDVRVGEVDAEGNAAQFGLGTTAGEKGGVVGVVGHSVHPEATVGRNPDDVGTLYARRQPGELEARQGKVEAEAVEIGHRQDQRRKAGDHVVRHDQAVAPVAVAVAAQHRGVVDLVPGQVVHLVWFEDGAAILLSGGTGLVPGVQIVAGDQLGAQRAVEGPGLVRVWNGVVGVVAVVAHGVVAVGRPIPAQKWPRRSQLRRSQGSARIDLGGGTGDQQHHQKTASCCRYPHSCRSPAANGARPRDAESWRRSQDPRRFFEKRVDLQLSLPPDFSHGADYSGGRRLAAR